MSLQIWLPFNGNAENHGLYNVTPTSTAWSSNSSGKIGLCAKLSTSSNFNTLLPISAWDYSEKSITFSLWVKINQSELNAITSTKSYTSTNTTAGGTLIGRHAYKGLALRWKTNNIYSSGSLSSVVVYMAARDNASHSYATSSVNIAWDKWTHIAGIFNRDLSRLELYINGDLSYTAAVNVSYFTSAALRSSNVFLNVAEWDGGNGNSVYAPWYVNDVRIYDHALSEKEVKELAKGLVLHYKLDDGYAEETTNLCAGLVHGGRTTVTDNTVTNTGENADTYWYIKPKEATVGNAIYTVSCDLSGFSTDSTYIQWGVVAQTSGLYWKTYNGHNEFTFTMPASRDGSTANIIFDDNGGDRTQIFKIYNVQLEKKDHATPYVGGPGLTRTPDTVFDSSGFKYNGTPANVEIISESPRYAKTTHFTGSTSKIHVSNLSTTGFSTTYTFSWWGKINSWSSKMFWGFSDGTRLNLYNGTYWNTGDGYSDPIYIPGTTTLIAAPSLNVWHHYAMVRDNDVCLLYLDGVLYGQAKTVKNINGTSIYFNGWDSSGSYTSTDMSMSDFRMYSTALSAEDILELYHTSASIDKAGNIHTRELIE